MATCPRCLGPLTDDHRCPRRRLPRALSSLSPGVIGALAGGVTAFAVDDDPAAVLVIAAAALGAVVAHAVRQAANPRL